MLVYHIRFTSQVLEKISEHLQLHSHIPGLTSFLPTSFAVYADSYDLLFEPVEVHHPTPREMLGASVDMEEYPIIYKAF